MHQMGTQSVGKAWLNDDGTPGDIEQLRSFARALYNDPQFMRMLDDPLTARDCEFPFYAIRHFALPSFGFVRLNIDYRPKAVFASPSSVEMTLTSLLYRVAYPDSVFTRGYHMSHLQSNAGFIGKFCVAPAYLVLESPFQNSIRTGCDARFQQLLEDMIMSTISANIVMSVEAVIFATGEMAKRLVCGAHHPPVCIYALHPHMRTLHQTCADLLRAKAAKVAAAPADVSATAIAAHERQDRELEQRQEAGEFDGFTILGVYQSTGQRQVQCNRCKRKGPKPTLISKFSCPNACTQQATPRRVIHPTAVRH